MTSPPKPAKPPKPVKAAEENKKAEKPALPKKRLLIIAAALLAVLALCLTVPKAINTAGEKKAEEARDTHLAELAAARAAIAPYNQSVISAGREHTAALRADGTAAAVGSNDCGQCDVSDWRDIIAVSAAGTHTIGLKADGTVIAVGDNNFDVCAVDGWHDIVAISTADETTMGLRSNGAVVIAGINFAEAPDWTDIALPE